jgi:hypothetical protein
VFASEFLGIQFLPGTTLTLTATFAEDFPVVAMFGL